MENDDQEFEYPSYDDQVSDIIETIIKTTKSGIVTDEFAADFAKMSFASVMKMSRFEAYIDGHNDANKGVFNPIEIMTGIVE